uniref:Uncharacterized protein n=1 Tax=Heterorhabditis bacteriophora TaxID=37862 RepID=A0A1I7WFD0_HETBA
MFGGGLAFAIELDIGKWGTKTHNWCFGESHLTDLSFLMNAYILLRWDTAFSLVSYNAPALILIDKQIKGGNYKTCEF